MIKDNGVGIDPADKEIIFDKFFSGWNIEHHHTSNYEFKGNGIGLGLYISKDFVKMHNGQIWIESEGLDKGSIFYFTIDYNLEKT
jgi:signal transduction histidine kinase